MRDQSAASAPLAFILAGALSVAAIGVITLSTGEVANSADTAPSQAENLKGQAESMLDLILLSPGHFQDHSGIQPWGKTEGVNLLELGDQADELQRLGLLDHESPYLDIDKFRNLKNSPFTLDLADGYVNYEEAQAHFGLDDQDLDFHIRAFPTLRDVQEILSSGKKDPNLRVTYIGNEDSTSGDEPALSAATCDTSPADAKSWRFAVTVENTGTTTTQFQGVFEIDEDGQGGSEVSGRKDQTGLVAPGVAVELWVDVENEGLACDASTEVTVQVYDPSKKRAEQTFIGPTLGTSPDPASQEFFVELDRMHHASTDTVEVGITGASNGEYVDWEVRTGTDPGDPLATCSIGSCEASHQFGGGAKHFEVEGLVEGVYTVYVTHRDSGVVSTQRILVEDDPVEEFTPSGGGSGPSFDESMAIEVAMIEKVVQNFCPAHHDDKSQSVWDEWDGETDVDPEPDDYWDGRCSFIVETTGPDGHEILDGPGGTVKGHQVGDVFWDDKSVLTDQVCKRLQYVQSNGKCQTGNTARLDITNVLFVGSNVDHNAMTSGGFKWPLRDWVEAGGTLIAFGSPEQTTQWLQPIFNVAEQSSSGALSTPDQSHSLLNVADSLSYDEYENHDKTWQYTGNADEHFTDVTKQGDDPITAISDPGAFGDGTVIITTWLPYDLFGDGAGTAEEEGLKMMNNFLMQGYRDLFLDYGPEIPKGVEVIPAFKRAQVDHEDLGLIDLDIALYVFPSR